MKLALTYPWDSPFCYSAGMECFLNLNHPAGHEVRWFRGKGWCQARAHIDMCEQALDWGADIICIMGSDQIHPADTVTKLFSHIVEGNCSAVAAMIPMRGHASFQEGKPFQKFAWRKVGDGRNDLAKQIDPEEGDLLAIDFVGSGVLMFKSELLQKVDKPWFGEDTKKFTEPERLVRPTNFDVDFVWRLQSQAGAQVWLDTTIDVKHLHIFEIDETYPERFADWALPGVGDPEVCK